MAEIKLHNPMNLDEEINLASAYNLLSFDGKEMADYILRCLGKREIILVDTLGENLNDPNAFNRTIEKLRLNGIDSKYKFLKYPQSQKSDTFRKLYVRRVA